MMKSLLESISDWMVNYKRTSVKSSTYDRLEISLKQLENYDISYIPASELTSDDIQNYLNELVDDGYALSTIKKQFHLISGYLEYANLAGVVARPVHKGVKIPKESSVKKHRKDVISYTRDEQVRLSEILERGDSPAFYAALLMLESGLRIGEALALTWSDVDWRRRAIRINKTLVFLGNSRKSFVQKEAKSYTSNRVIPLSKKAFDLLSYMKNEDPNDLGVIFHNHHGDHLTYEAVRWWIRKACDEADVPYYGQHVFRHTFATNCYEKGCDVKVLSKLLGHSDVTITYNIYIHLFGDALEEMRLIVG